MNIFDLHAKSQQLFEIHRSFLLIAPIAVIGAYMDYQVLADSKWHDFCDLDATKTCQTLLQSLM